MLGRCRAGLRDTWPGACLVRHMFVHAHAGHDAVACVSQGLQLGAGQGYCSWGLNNMHGAVGGSCGWGTHAAGSHAWKGLRVLKVSSSLSCKLRQMYNSNTSGSTAAGCSGLCSVLVQAGHVSFAPAGL